MGLALVVAVVAVALTLLTLASVALVQLVLFISVRRMALALAACFIYWFISSRRRQVAKGFYSCRELPGAAVREPTRRTVAPKREETRERASGTTETEATRLEVNTANRSSEPENSSKCRKEPEEKQGLQATTRRRMETAELSQDEMGRGEQATSKLPSAVPITPPRLPELRRKRWTTPSHSMPVKKKHEERLLGRTSPSSSSPASSSGSPLDRERFGSPRSIALEQKLMHSALESEGYWIGDFRLPPPSQPRRTQSNGAKTLTAGAAMQITNRHEAPRSMRTVHQL